VASAPEGSWGAVSESGQLCHRRSQLHPQSFSFRAARDSVSRTAGDESRPRGAVPEAQTEKVRRPGLLGFPVGSLTAPRSTRNARDGTDVDGRLPTPKGLKAERLDSVAVHALEAMQSIG